MKTNRIIPALLIAVLGLAGLNTRAAVAPLSEKGLKQIANVVVTGNVIKVTSKVQKSKIETAVGVHRDRVFRIVLKVDAVAKGKGIKVGDKIVLLAWKPVTRIPPLPGPQGHGTMPTKGQAITAYLKAKDGDSYRVLLPNGISIKKPVAAENAGKEGK